MRDSEKITLY